MGTILGDMFKKVGGGLGKVFDGDILDGLGDVLGGVGRAAGRTVNGALNLVGLGDGDIDPTGKLLLCEIALLAKMAKADGRVDKAEIDFMKSLFDEWELDANLRKTLQGFFNEQKKNTTDATEWAHGVLQAAIEMNPDDGNFGIDIRLNVYRHLFLMALADGELDNEEISLLRTLPDPLGFKPEVFDLIAGELAGALKNPDEDATLAKAYATLGVSPDASNAEVNRAWKKKMAAFHPDKIQGKDLDPEWMELANQKSAEINKAYETIKNARENGLEIDESISGSRKATQSTARKPSDQEIGLSDGMPSDPETNAVLGKFQQTYDWLKKHQYPDVGKPGILYRNPDGGWQCNCENWAAITLRPGAAEPFEVHGAICARWYEEGGAFNEHGKPGKLGYPISDERPYSSMGRDSDRISYFERGDIVWNSERNTCYTSLKDDNPETTFATSPKTNSVRYQCPHCGGRIEVEEDSDEYLVACSSCGAQLDLTELEPES